MSFVSEYNLGREASTTYFLASLACFLWDTVLWRVFTLPDRRERKQAVRIVGVGTGCSVAWLPIIPIPVQHFCQVPIAKRLSLNQYSCHGTRFMLLFAHSYAVHLTARTYYLRGV